MSGFSLSALKNALLKTKSTPAETEISDTKVYLRRLMAAELIDHGDVLIEAQTSDNAHMVSELNVRIVISSLVHPDDSPIKAKGKPTAKELLAARDNVILLDAVDKVKKHAIGKLETAEKNWVTRPGWSWFSG